MPWTRQAAPFMVKKINMHHAGAEIRLKKSAPRKDLRTKACIWALV
jgi:hypothetical protein